MKKLIYGLTALLIVGLVGCRRNRMERQYERFLEDSDRMEFITPSEDTMMVVDDDDDDMDWMEDDGELIVIPDIPQERDVDMGASDYELEKMMTGRGD